MSMTNPSDVQNQIVKFWSDDFEQELREDTLLPSMVNKKYEGQIQKKGDTVYINQLNAPSGQTLTIGTDSDSFDTQPLSVQRVSLQINKRFVAAYEFEDLMDIQTQIGKEKPEVFDALRFAIEKQLNDYLYSLLSPSSSAPDHLITSVTDLNTAQLSAVRILAAQAKWSKKDGWFGLVDPVYYGDILDDTTIASKDFGADDAPMINGQLALKRFGFMIFEDNSDGILTISDTDAQDCAVFFNKDFMHLAQGSARFLVSSLHANKQFGYVLSVDKLGGAVLGNDGNVKHITVQNAA